VLFNFFVIVEPLIYFRICDGTPLTNFEEDELRVRKSNISLLHTSTNTPLLQKLKSKKFETRLSLHFWNVYAIFRIWQKNVYLKYQSSHFLTLAIELHVVRFGLGASFKFELHCSLPSTPLLSLSSFT